MSLMSQLSRFLIINTSEWLETFRPSISLNSDFYFGYGSRDHLSGLATLIRTVTIFSSTFHHFRSSSWISFVLSICKFNTSKVQEPREASILISLLENPMFHSPDNEQIQWSACNRSLLSGWSLEAVGYDIPGCNKRFERNNIVGIWGKILHM